MICHGRTTPLFDGRQNEIKITVVLLGYSGLNLPPHNKDIITMNVS